MEKFKCPSCWEEWFVISQYQKGIENHDNTKCAKCKKRLREKLLRDLLNKTPHKPVKTPPLHCPDIETYARFME